MERNTISNVSEHLFRVDKFMVPNDARAEFLERVETTHALLKTQPGFVRQLLLEQSSGPGEFNFVTLVEWENQAAIEEARKAVTAMHKRIGFNPQEMLARLGIRADLANYRCFVF